MKSLMIMGGRELNGEVHINGSKNSALPIIAASILAKGKVTLTNIPRITDVFDMLKILDYLNVKYMYNGNNLTIDSTNIEYNDLLSEEVKKIRASYYFIGAMLSVFKKVKITTPGGCNIGARPIDLHIKVLEEMGAIAKQNKKNLSMKIENYKKITFLFPRKSVGATINAILAAANSNETIELLNVASEPEVIDVINFLNKMGCKIKVGNNKYICYKHKELNKEMEYQIIPDRIEAATYITLGLLCGDIKVNNLNKSHLKSILKPLRKNNANLIIKKNYVMASKSKIKAFNIKVGEYPDFPTDAQPIIFVLLALSEGSGVVIDNIFEARFKSCVMLNKMGANINIDNDNATYQGVPELLGYEVEATDLRCAASLLLAGLVAHGTTTIKNIDYIERGYADIFENIKNLGGNIQLVTEN